MSEVATKRTPLYDEHLKRGAKMISFGEWIMPVHYSSIVDEHRAVRKNVGIFDISHMGQFVIGGNDAADWLNTMLTNNVQKLQVAEGQYTFLLNETGGVIDDLIIYRIADRKFLLVVNAARLDEDFAWLQKWHRLPAGVYESDRQDADATIELVNRSSVYGAVAIQGPRVADLFQHLLGKDFELPARNHIADCEIDGIPVSVARTGYTGEDGVEVFLRAEHAAPFWNLILNRGGNLGIQPCGLGARDTLRLEMCYPLNGSDLSPQRNPIEAGLGFFVDLSKPKFIGREVLVEAKQNGTRQKLIAFRMEGKGPPPRPHYRVFSNGAEIGEVTSGTLSPSLNYGIGMAYVDSGVKIGSKIEIEIRAQKFPAVIEKKPLYKKQT